MERVRGFDFGREETRSLSVLCYNDEGYVRWIYSLCGILKSFHGTEVPCREDTERNAIFMKV
jgi:hypothetical protein